VSFSANDRLRRSWPSWVHGDPSREHARDAKARLSELIREAQHGVGPDVARNGQPVAMIVPWEPDRPGTCARAWAGLSGAARMRSQATTRSSRFLTIRRLAPGEGGARQPYDTSACSREAKPRCEVPRGWLRAQMRPTSQRSHRGNPGSSDRLGKLEMPDRLTGVLDRRFAETSPMARVIATPSTTVVMVAHS
jgi:antitoxin (DNA-binding transcriptional repressor) of toxin-antitoxin stability system